MPTHIPNTGKLIVTPAMDISKETLEILARNGRAVIDPNPIPVQKTAFWAKQAWIAILTAAGALEIYGVLRKGPDDTLTETTRWIWRTNTPAGKWAFRIFWVAFAAWFGPHIVKIEKQIAAKKS